MGLDIRIELQVNTRVVTEKETVNTKGEEHCGKTSGWK